MKRDKIVGVFVLFAMLGMLLVPFMSNEVEASELVFQIDGTKSTSTLSIAPGATGDFSTLITNNNGSGDMTIAFTSDGSADWYSIQTLNASGGAQSSFVVGSGNTTNVTVRVTVTDETDDPTTGGTVDDFIVTAKDKTRALASTQTFTVKVGEKYEMNHFIYEVSGSTLNKVYTKSIPTNGGKVALYQLKLENTGNTVITASVSLNDSGLPIYCPIRSRNIILWLMWRVVLS